MKRASLAGLVLALLLLGAATPAPTAEATGAPTATRAGLTVTKGLLVLGDSISYNSRRELLKRRPGWRVDARRGRPVTALPGLVDDLIASGRVPRNLVIALGSNARWWWGKRHYAAVADSLPSRVSITFMTTYRDPRFWGGHPNWGKRPRVQKRYSRWMRRIAAPRANVCTMPWRHLVKTRPHLLRDGVHPNARGKVRWAKLLIRSTRDCRRAS